MSAHVLVKTCRDSLALWLGTHADRPWSLFLSAEHGYGDDRHLINIHTLMCIPILIPNTIHITLTTIIRNVSILLVFQKLHLQYLSWNKSHVISAAARLYSIDFSCKFEAPTSMLQGSVQASGALILLVPSDLNLHVAAEASNATQVLQDRL